MKTKNKYSKPFNCPKKNVRSLPEETISSQINKLRYATGWTLLSCRLHSFVGFCLSMSRLLISLSPPKKPFASGTIMHLNQICINLLTQSLGRNEHLSPTAFLPESAGSSIFSLLGEAKERGKMGQQKKRANVRPLSCAKLFARERAPPRYIRIRTELWKTHPVSAKLLYTYTYKHRVHSVLKAVKKSESCIYGCARDESKQETQRDEDARRSNRFLSRAGALAEFPREKASHLALSRSQNYISRHLCCQKHPCIWR